MRFGPVLRDVVGIAASFLLLAQGLDAATAVPPRQECDPAKPAVAGVTTPEKNPERTAFLGDWVDISVCNIQTFAAEAATHQKDVTLYVDGLDTGVKASKIDYESGLATFVLDRNEKNKDLWAPLLYDPLFNRTEKLFVSIGERGEQPLPRLRDANMQITLDKVYHDWTTLLWLALLLCVVVFSIRFARRSDMLRDAPAVDGVRQTYSLARVQMAWWFVLVVNGFVFIWLITGDYRDTITPSILGLMGISAATGLAAVAVSPRSTERGTALAKAFDDEKAVIDAKVQKVNAEIEATQKEIDDLKAANQPADKLETLKADLATRRTDLDVARGKLLLQTISVTSNFPSKGFWTDLVSDDRGAVALDRFQIVVWTAVLGGFFLTSVFWDLAMPEFNATVLGLMGISSGTYIGFKLPPKKSEG
jgi:hypothetical protein